MEVSSSYRVAVIMRASGNTVDRKQSLWQEFDRESIRSEVFLFPLGKFWNNGITIGQGQAPVKKYNAHLRDLIIAGQGWTKILLKPEAKAA
jgi:hypothetical protein